MKDELRTELTELAEKFYFLLVLLGAEKIGRLISATDSKFQQRMVWGENELIL